MDVQPNPSRGGLTMSETSTATPTGLGTGSTSSPLYGPSGDRLQSGWRQNQGQSDQIGDFVMQQPMTAALVALVVGYFLGKLT
jgi:cytochrome c oxidase assembly factor CtaG